MILFKKVRWKNFLSTGNQWTEIDLTRSKSTLIVGENGAGKSTMLDAICYGLYGKPYRKISKPQLVNSINNKNAEVEVEFTIGNKEYKIRRGQKPIFLEVYQNDVLINQNAAVKDYQEVIEKSILKLTFKSFSQVVILGSASFTPFMQLTAQNRREVIEDLLDIQIFSVMNTLLKDKVNGNKQAIIQADHNINIVESKIELIDKHIAELEQNNESIITEKMRKGQEIANQITAAKESVASLLEQIQNKQDAISNANELKEQQQRVLSTESKLEDKIRRLNEEITFFHDHDSCPTCMQGIEHDFKEERIQLNSNRLSEHTQHYNDLSKEYEALADRISAITKVQEEITNLQIKVTGINSNIGAWNQIIASLKEEIISLKNSNKQITNNNEEIAKHKASKKQYEKQKEKLVEERQLLQVASHLLKDTGIKTKIIRQYVPIMNKLINKYLAAMDFFVQFELDENFNEKIKSRFRDDFSYDSFSEGEKMRIDLSLLFTWRAIAKLRNSATTNLLIMDEVFDSSLDTTGTEEFLKILNQLASDTNVFIISHKGDQLYDKFHSVIRFEKHKNFSRIAQ